jgi:hypothetical protein
MHVFLGTTYVINIQDSYSTTPHYYFEFVTIETILERVGDNNVLSGSIIHKLPYNNINCII